MHLKSLKSKLMLAVSGLVIGSGLLISLLVIQRYSVSLLDTMAAQARDLAHGIALEAADNILINDLVGLQKMLDNQMHSNPAVAYLFVFKDGQVLAHTFKGGVPAQLISANHLTRSGASHSQKIASKAGERYLDMAWPIFGGKAGVLRLGFSERPYRRELTRLWLQMIGLTLGILLLALAGTLFFIRRITRPLEALTRATQEIDQGELGTRVSVTGGDEFETLAASFNAMVERIQIYTARLEEQTLELDRAYHQTSTFCKVVKEIGAFQGLDEMGTFLIKTLGRMLNCRHITLLLSGINNNLLFSISANDFTVLERPPELIASGLNALNRITTRVNSKKKLFKSPFIPAGPERASDQVIIPVRYEDSTLGALILLCQDLATYSEDDIELAGLTLNQAAGALRRAVLREEKIRNLDSRLAGGAEFCGMVGKDPKMQVVYRLIEDIASTDATVLIQGESGTGKELVANAIRQKSPRSQNPFVVINCSAYPETLLESELFGHEKGAFTGASQQKMGRFEQADGGTVFLDEIGEISPSAQIKLLRVLQTRKFERIGGTKTHSVDVRILAATNKNLIDEVKAGRFREDLFYRLNVIPIVLPPLRDRGNDISLLARFFLRNFADEQQKVVEDFSRQAMRLLLDHTWPGNVRELENHVEHAVILATDEIIEANDLPSGLANGLGSNDRYGEVRSLEDHEKEILRRVLNNCSWNKKEAASRLGISRSTLYEKLKKYQIIRPVTH